MREDLIYEDMITQEIKFIWPKSKKAKVKYTTKPTIFETCSVWKIANIRQLNRCGPSDYGKTIVASIFHDKPNRLIITSLDYNVRNFKKTNGKIKFSFVIKNGKLNIYKTSICQNIRTVRNITNSPHRIYDELGLAKKAHLERLRQILNEFFKNNGLKIELKRNAKSGMAIFEQLLEEVYPVLKEFGITKAIQVYPPYSRFLKNGNIKSFIKKCFAANSKKITKLFIKRIVSAPHEFARISFFGILCKNKLKIDDFQQLLDNQDFQGMPQNSREFGLMKKFLQQFSRERLLRWFKEINTNSTRCDGILLRDCASMFDYTNQPHIPSGIKGLREIHDWLARESAKIQNNVKEIRYSETHAKLNGVEIDNLRIETPEDTGRLIEYSQIMHNCISSYGEGAVKNRHLLLGIYKDGELTYNICIINQKLRQFFGARNSLPDETDKRKICEYLVNQKVLIENYADE